MQNKEDFGVNKGNMIAITKNVTFKMLKLKEMLVDEYEIHLSKKNLSEIVGKIFEKESAAFLTKNTKYKVVNAQSDKDPDLTFFKGSKTVHKVEIKITSTTNAWLGGEFSRRPFDYLLISWGENFTDYFIAYTHLETDEWQSNISKRFYGPSYKTKFLKEKQDKNIFLGSLSESGTKLIRENIYQKKFDN